MPTVESASLADQMTATLRAAGYRLTPDRTALIGYMAGPGELGLEWNPEKFGV